MMMALDRRSILKASALAGGGLLLPSCASLPKTRGLSTVCTPLPPVKVDAGRVIRTVAGLRPYRDSGFVVRRDQLGDKTLVHNYGHGGAGITLSWGSSRIAADLGLPGHSGPVAVIGAGVMGLTTARLVQEAGFPVTLYAAALPPDTTSNIAGGNWGPYGHYKKERVTPEWNAQFAAALEYSWRRFQIMVGEDYGVRWLPTYSEGGYAGPHPLDPYFPGTRWLDPSQHPFPIGKAGVYETMYVETGRFLRELTKDVQIGGGTIQVRKFATPADLLGLKERLVFNCTGLGSRELFGDTDLRPARGQLAILLPQPEVRYAFTGDGIYMFPRPDGILLGGTFELDQWSTVPEPAAIERILAKHKALFDGLRCTA